MSACRSMAYLISGIDLPLLSVRPSHYAYPAGNTQPIEMTTVQQRYEFMTISTSAETCLLNCITPSFH